MVLRNIDGRVSVKSRIASFSDFSPPKDTFFVDLISGFSKLDKSLPCKYFYDDEGSQLFDQICELSEYYLTRTEALLLHEKAAEISTLVGPEALLIEYGCGVIEKARVLLDVLSNPAAFVAVDISPGHLRAAAERLARDYPKIEVHAICTDFSEPFNIPNGLPGRRRVGFFPGSTIGNFGHNRARQFLSRIAEHIGPGGGLIIGVDLKKDEAILRAAYNDESGITAQFNLNLLSRINREFGGDINLDQFKHEAVYNSEKGRIEMYLISCQAQTIRIGNRPFSFSENEKIHTENSQKYDITEFQELASDAGFKAIQVWSDLEGLYSIHYFERPTF